MTPQELHVKLDGYCDLREALGFRPSNTRNALGDFLRYWQAKGCPEPIQAQIAVEWACLRGTAPRRLSVVRCFLSHLRATLPETEIPDRSLVATYRRPKPYILSETQIQTLMETALRARPRGTLRPHTIHTLIGLLASTGLRSGEALRLTMPDVRLDLTPPRLQVLDSKFHKSRLVPLHPTTADHLRSYIERRKDLGLHSASGPFLISNQGAALPAGVPREWFRRLTRNLGWRAPGERPPVLNALRHTFAVRRMVMWHQEGVEVMALLPHLSVYLGHLRPEETYWYLSAVPELLGAAAQRFQPYSGQGGER